MFIEALKEPVPVMIPEETRDQFWKTVLDIMDEAIMLIENGGTILFVNRAMESLTGYSQSDLVGKKCAVLEFDCCIKTGKGEQKAPCPLFRSGELVNKRCSLRRKNGSLLNVLKNARVLRDERGEAVCAVEIQSDLSAREERDREITRLLCVLQERQGFHGIIGVSPAMRNLFDLIKKAAASEAPVLIYGETGTGKELVACAIHRLGSRSEGPLIRVNCAALSQSLLESELFGHVKGAYTGADRTTKGRFQAAHSGEIFLDEIGDVPLSTQVKLLRVIQEKELERVGDYKPIKIDVRVIAATHRDLRALIKKGLFRDDLFYRLNVIPIFISPLRERREDIPLLTEHFIGEIAARTGKKIRGLDRNAMEFFMHYDWPGNVRELINVIEYAFVVCGGEFITESDLPECGSIGPQGTCRLMPDEPTRNDEKERLIEALRAAKGKRGVAARMLGVSRQTVWARIKRFGIDPARL